MEHQPNQVDVWIAFADRVQDPELISRYRVLMSADEREREARFHFAVDRHRYLVTRALVRTTLSLYRPEVPPNDWSFQVNPYGRPRITNAEAGSIGFNVSHSGNVVALAVGNALEIGFDLEVIADRSPSIELASEFFAMKEAAALRSLPPAAQAMRFLELWTLKESFIKACGKGLSIPLDKFSFDLDPSGSICFDAGEDVGSAGREWQFIQVLIPEVAVFALCTEYRGVGVDIRLNDAVPLLTTKSLHCRTLRRSHRQRSVPTSRPG
jgi:4'-phosphopantetheinyl transferase